MPSNQYETENIGFLCSGKINVDIFLKTKKSLIK